MSYKGTETDEKIRVLDETDRRILNILSDNARTKLTVIARKVNLSIDSTKKRVQKLEDDGVITKYTIQPDVHKLGLTMGIHIYIKLRNINQERYDEFIEEMKKNSRIIDLLSMMGDYDIYLVILAKNSHDYDKIKMEIKQKYTDIIGEWKELIVANLYKLEEYKF